MDDLLDMIQQGQTSSIPEMARRLQISEELLYARLERYEQLGFVKRVRVDTSECGGNCKRCQRCSSVKTERPLIYWEKGEKLQ